MKISDFFSNWSNINTVGIILLKDALIASIKGDLHERRH
jgi:hypothetical protein